MTIRTELEPHPGTYPRMLLTEAEQSCRIEGLLTLSEVASRLGVKPALLRTWRNRGQGPRSFKIGASVVYLRRDVEKWEAAHREAESA